MFYKIIKLLALCIALFLIYIAFQSPKMQIARELFIKAPAETIFPYINSSKKANEWMPWAESDPKAKMTYSGPDEGVGSTSSWESDGQLGTGKAEIIESQSNKLVKTQLIYTKPMDMRQLAEISLTPAGDGTIVKWSVSGEPTYLCRVISFFMNMEKMIGREFEKGLTKLKLTIER